MTRTIAVTIVQQPSRRLRPPMSIRALGCTLHPEAITDAWYAADCPPDFKPVEHGVSRADCLRWRLACLLRGCRP